MRPTCNKPCGGCELVVDEVDINIHAIACCSSAHNSADAHCGTTAASNDATEVAFTNANFQQHFVAIGASFNNNRIWVVNDGTHDMVEHCRSNRCWNEIC